MKIAEAPRIEDEAERTEWRRPEMTKLSLAATLLGSGSVIDGADGGLPGGES